MLGADLVVVGSVSETGAPFRSLLIPGWGQSYNGDGTGLALVGFSVFESVRFNGARDDYHAAKTTPEASSGYDRMRELNREKNIAYIATRVFGGFNAAEAFISGTSASSVRVEASAAPTSGAPALRLAYR